MYFKQHYLGCLAQASYLIADEEAKEAVVVDPRRDVDLYIEEAEEKGCKITAVILTHFHADFVAGHLELQEQTGAKIYLGKSAQAEYNFEGVGDGDVIRVGDTVRLEILETPGHTPEGISIVVYDETVSKDIPHGVMTGDTLFIGGTGRPDLMASVGISAEELAGQLYDSIRGKLMKLPPQTVIYPGHGPGSACGKFTSDATFAPLADQLRDNAVFRDGLTKEAFIEEVTSGQPFAPAYFPFAAQLNKKEREHLGSAMEKSKRELGIEEVLRLVNAGAQLVDTRSCEDYAALHLKDSHYVGLQGLYATWCGTLLDREHEIIVVTDEGKEHEAIMRMGRIGFDHIAGYVNKPMKEIAADYPDAVESTVNITPEEAAQFLGSEHTVFLDVRGPGEFEGGHIEGAVNICLQQLKDHLDEVPKGERIIVNCETGYRSLAAISILQRHGITNLHNLVGGWEAWDKANQPVGA